MMQDQVIKEVKSVPVSSEEIKNVSNEKPVSSEVIRNVFKQKESAYENSVAKIWSEITSSRVKQVKQVIEIMEQKGQNNNESTNSGEAQPRNQVEQAEQAPQDPSIQASQSNPLSIQNKAFQKQAQDKSFPLLKDKDKDQYITRQLFSSNQANLEYLMQFKENQRIHSIKMDQMFISESLHINKEFFKESQLKAVEWMITTYVKPGDHSQQYNLIRTIDLLYKKFILKPFKQNQQQLTAQTTLAFDIYKPDPIYAESLHPLKDDSIPSNLYTSQSSDSNSLKRMAAGKKYGENYVSLIENQSTNENQDYLEAIANNYVNGIRKQKFSDDPVRHIPLNSQLPKPNPQPAQPGDKFKKYGNSSTDIQLPFDIEIPNHNSKRQFNQQYNLFQGPDDQKSERFTQQRLVAKTFVKDGYGLQIVRNYMGPSMDGGTYNRAITTIIRESYKKIEEFLTKNCNIKIHSLTSSEFSLVKTPLVHCRNILRPEDLRTFFKYVAITYKFGKLKQEDSPTAEQTLSLYNAILRGLSDRKTAKDTLHKPSNHKDMYYKI